MDHAKSRRRRTHSKQLKSEVVAACAEPGASVAAIALARGLNTNLVHKWRRQASPPAGVPVDRKTPATAPTSHRAEFVAVPLPAASPTILVEIRRGATSVAVHWPLSAAGECAAWLGTWLR
jgi:transposase